VSKETPLKVHKQKPIAQPTVSARVEPGLFQALEKIASEERRTLGQIVRFAIEEYLQRRRAA
jgi:predicted transcriptional regulator